MVAYYKAILKFIYRNEKKNIDVEFYNALDFPGIDIRTSGLQGAETGNIPYL